MAVSEYQRSTVFTRREGRKSGREREGERVGEREGEREGERVGERVGKRVGERENEKGSKRGREMEGERVRGREGRRGREGVREGEREGWREREREGEGGRGREREGRREREREGGREVVEITHAIMKPTTVREARKGGMYPRAVIQLVVMKGEMQTGNGRLVSKMCTVNSTCEERRMETHGCWRWLNSPEPVGVLYCSIEAVLLLRWSYY